MSSGESRQANQTLQGSKWWVAAGIFFLVLGIYVLTSPGRIDLVDGQVRFDVAYNWLKTGRPVVGDPWIGPWMGVPGKDRKLYSYYGPAGSVFSMPLVWFGGIRNLTALETSRFLFSMTSPIFGALIALVLFLFYLELEIPIKQAVACTIVSTFATLLWPASNSSFDNAQHAFFALGAMYFGFRSTKSSSKALAILAGLLAGVLILYQAYFLLIIPGLAVSTLNWKSMLPNSLGATQGSMLRRTASRIGRMIHGPFVAVRSAWRGPGEARESCLRFAAFFFAVSVELVLYFAYNDLRFGSYFDDGKLRTELHRPFPLLGNPLAGLLTLLVSPGKSIFLYSPPVILGAWGMRYLRRRSPEITFGILANSIVLLLFISCISFASGDWCWGPRYLVVLLPLWALAFPFVAFTSFRRKLVKVIVALGLVVQVLGLSVEHQRFFFEKGLNDFFWAEDAWVYFKHSALFARVAEAISLYKGPPPTAHWFNALPVPDWATYSPLGPPIDVPRKSAREWIRNFKIYFVPRPWPFWMAWIKPELRPINLQMWIWGLIGMITMGGAFIHRGLRMVFSPETTHNLTFTQELAQL